MKKIIKRFLKFTGLLPLVKKIIAPGINLNQPPKEVFVEIYKKNYWKSKESVSGPGSTLAVTSKTRDDIKYIIDKYQINTLLDIPCGDFNWMKEIMLKENGVSYLGCDIVPEIIKKNNENYSDVNIKFEEKNIITDKIEKHDMILCRDCLVHFSNADIFKALKNIKNSNSTYLLVTSFLDIENNIDIETGQWRAIDLRKYPFEFTNPLEIFTECNTEKIKRQKALMLFEIENLKIN